MHVVHARRRTRRRLGFVGVDAFFVVDGFAVVAFVDGFFAAGREAVALAFGNTRDGVLGAASCVMPGISFVTGTCGASCMCCMVESCTVESRFVDSVLFTAALSPRIGVPGMFFMSCIGMAVPVSRRAREESGIDMPGMTWPGGCVSVGGIRMPGGMCAPAVSCDIGIDMPRIDMLSIADIFIRVGRTRR